MRGRPGLITDYRRDMAILPSTTQRTWFAAMAVVLVLIGLQLPADLALLGATAAIASVGAIGLNLVTGWAGQVSLGHAFFLGLGAFTAAVLNGDPDGRLIGFGLEMWIWLPAAGLVAAAAGLIAAPIAFRLRGLYLAFVTLGLVFIGDHFFREWRSLTGGQGVGRPAADPEIFGFDLGSDGEVFGIFLEAEQKFYFFGLLVLLVMAFLAKNLVRSRIGRAFAAIRDRDIAAEIIGVSLSRYKMIAFAISSFYAGIAGALIWMFIGFVEPTSFNILLSIEYVAMVLIGGVATISGSIMGAVFITFLSRIVDNLSGFLPFISDAPAGGFLTKFQVEEMLFGALIIGFLILEPLGLYGLWIRVRNYFKAWPFSY
ncbi:MAG: branched-chain amino acid ABC transporter permease [Acidimicrobiia bacterium]